MSEINEAPPAETPETPVNGVEAAPPEAAEETQPARTVEELENELAKTRREAAKYRTKLREVEPLAKKAQEAEEANKTETQKAVERAQAAENAMAELETRNTMMELAVQYQIPPDDIELIGSGTREEMDAKAARLAALHAAASKASPPPTDRPVEGLRPGATPEPPKPADDSYPSAWTPPYLRDNDSRSQYGQ